MHTNNVALLLSNILLVCYKVKVGIIDFSDNSAGGSTGLFKYVKKGQHWISFKTSLYWLRRNTGLGY